MLKQKEERNVILNIASNRASVWRKYIPTENCELHTPA
jgi:hypothetical protein